jgi:hypothetical protein
MLSESCGDLRIVEGRANVVIACTFESYALVVRKFIHQSKHHL